MTTSPSPSASGSGGAPLSPLQTALAAEHAAVYVYGVLGGRTSRSSDPALSDALRSAYDTHRARRDQLSSLVADTGEDPVGPEPAYATPAGIGTATGVRRAALALERACTETYGWLVSQTRDADRSLAVSALKDAAVRELAFGGAARTLPGAR